MKKGPAIIAAFVTTIAVGLVMLAVGINAFFNPTSVAAAASPASGATVNTNAEVQQLQSLVAQYQSREKQYQDQLNQLKQQVNQNSTSLQQYQSLFGQLQQMGVLVVRNGQIFVRRSGFNSNFGGGDDDNNNNFPSGPGGSAGTGL